MNSGLGLWERKVPVILYSLGAALLLSHIIDLVATAPLSPMLDQWWLGIGVALLYFGLAWMYDLTLKLDQRAQAEAEQMRKCAAEQASLSKYQTGSDAQSSTE